MNSEVKLHTDLSLKYLVHTHGETKDKPLIIFLHGFGSNEEDLFTMRSEFIADCTYVSVRAPLPLYSGSFQWFRLQMPAGGLLQIANELQDNRRLLEKFIQEVAQKYQTTKDKIIMIGFSQGAIMSYEVALRNPTAVRGIIALSGAILPTLSPLLTKGYDLKNLAIFIGHGTHDNRVPFTAATSAHDLLSLTTVKPEFHSYAGLGHTINHRELADIKTWIQKTLNLIPRKEKEPTQSL